MSVSRPTGVNIQNKLSVVHNVGLHAVGSMTTEKKSAEQHSINY